MATITVCVHGEATTSEECVPPIHCDERGEGERERENGPDSTQADEEQKEEEEER